MTLLKGLNRYFCLSRQVSVVPGIHLTNLEIIIIEAMPYKPTFWGTIIVLFVFTSGPISLLMSSRLSAILIGKKS
jgi:hypothetical protein